MAFFEVIFQCVSLGAEETHEKLGVTVSVPRFDLGTSRILVPSV